MQLQDIQAFVRPHAIFPYWRVRSAELSEIGEDRLAEALLLPNCTPEVADAVKARMCEGGEVRDLRVDVASKAASIAGRWKDDLARALDMPEGRPFAEYVESVSGLMSEHTAAKKRLAPEGTVSPQEYENVRADNERLRSEVARLEQVASELQESFNEGREERERFERELKIALGYTDKHGHAWTAMICEVQSLRLRSESAVPLASLRAACGLSESAGVEDVAAVLEKRLNGAFVCDELAERAYNQGCADTIAAFRKAQGEGQ